MSRTRRIAVLTASVATAGILGVTGVAYAGDYDGGHDHDGGRHHSRHHDHDGWNRGGWDHGRGGYGRCDRDRGLVGNLLHNLLGGGC